MEIPNTFLWTNSNSNCSSNGGLGARSVGAVSPGSSGLGHGSGGVKCEKSLNFSTAVTSEEDEYGFHDRRKMSRDPMSHRIIEKRRRDRMNNCLADLSRLIPAEYLKKGRGRIEKTEIIEMAIKHMKYLHGVLCSRSPNAASSTELPLENSHLLDNYELDKVATKEETADKPTEPVEHSKIETDSPPPINLEHFKLGYQECLSESMHYLVEVKGYYPGSSLCMQLICHLQKHCDKILKGDRLNKPRAGDSTSTSNSPSSSVKPHGSGSSSGDSCERGPTSERLQPKPEPSESPYDATTTREMAQYEAASHQHQGYERVAQQRYEPAATQARDYSSSPRDAGRDNLTLPNLSLFNIEQEHHQHSAGGLTHLHETYPTETSPCPSHSADSSLYKFKNNIKQRFTAEHSIHQNGSSSGYLSAPPTKKAKTVTNKYDDSPSNDSQYESRSHDFPSDLSRHYDTAPRSVAIFALHGDGTFYIPLTVDYTCLLPYLGAYSLRRTSRSPPLVLHPVTLSVCFQQNGTGVGYARNTSGTSSSDFGPGSLVKVSK